MSKLRMDTSLLDLAMHVAIDAHQGTERNGQGFPYIIHPMEAVSIVATMTSDQELLAAAALHDVLEDTDATFDSIEEVFGTRVANLVAADSITPETGISDEASWHDRKQLAIDRLAAADRDSKIVALGDKLSNMRAIARDYRAEGDACWEKFHTSDPTDHAWYYRGLATSLDVLRDTDAYKEFVALIEKTFR